MEIIFQASCFFYNHQRGRFPSYISWPPCKKRCSTRTEGAFGWYIVHHTNSKLSITRDIFPHSRSAVYIGNVDMRMDTMRCLGLDIGVQHGALHSNMALHEEVCMEALYCQESKSDFIL